MRTGALAAQGTVTSPSLNGQGSPNILRNGDFEVAQRGATFAAAEGYTLDGFYHRQMTDAVCTVTQDTAVPTFAQAGHLSRHSLKVQVTTIDGTIGAAQYGLVFQRIEGYDIYPAVGKAVTLSFWVKAKKTGVYCVSFRNAGSDRSMVKEYTISVADTWEKKTITVTMDYSGGTWDYTTGIGLNVSWALAVGSDFQTTKDVWQTGNYSGTSSQVNAFDSTDNYLSISQAKLEMGTVATAFAPAPYAQELARCMRYYRQIPFYARYCSTSVGRVALNNSANFPYRFDQPMRTAPISVAFLGTTTALTIYDSTGFSTSVVLNSATMAPDGGMVYMTCGGTGLTPGRACEVYDDTATPNSSIYFSAEL